MLVLVGLCINLATAVVHAQQDTPVWQGEPPPVGLPVNDLTCRAEQTGGFHDHPGGDEVYEPALFHPDGFRLLENNFLTENLAHGPPGVDLYLTLIAKDGLETELECRAVRGSIDSKGFSCVNAPPSQMLLINSQTLRFTRTAVGGWTFTGASDSMSGDSIFVEYGRCEATAVPGDLPETLEE
jgi:hypothetical protein